MTEDKFEEFIATILNIQQKLSEQFTNKKDMTTNELLYSLCNQLSVLTTFCVLVTEGPRHGVISVTCNSPIVDSIH